MGQRSALHDILLGITDHVYFQPPDKLVMEYPCIVYRRDYRDTKYADNKPYSTTRRYQVTVIDRDPDSPIVEQVAALPMCASVRNFSVDNLNHDIFQLYF